MTWRQIGELSPFETNYSLSMVQCRLAHGELMRVRNSAETMLPRLTPGAVATRMTAMPARLGGGHRARPRRRPERRGGVGRIVPNHNTTGRTNRLRSKIDTLREAVERDRQWFDEQFDHRTSAADDAIEAHANWQAVVDRLLQ